MAYSNGFLKWDCRPLKPYLCHAMVQLKKEHPKLGKQSQIWALTLDKVYATFGVSAPEQTQNVCFRFLPDMKQVTNAMQASP